MPRGVEARLGVEEWTAISILRTKQVLRFSSSILGDTLGVSWRLTVFQTCGIGHSILSDIVKNLNITQGPCMHTVYCGTAPLHTTHYRPTANDGEEHRPQAPRQIIGNSGKTRRTRADAPVPSTCSYSYLCFLWERSTRTMTRTQRRVLIGFEDLDLARFCW